MVGTKAIVVEEQEKPKSRNTWQTALEKYRKSKGNKGGLIPKKGSQEHLEVTAIHEKLKNAAKKAKKAVTSKQPKNQKTPKQKLRSNEPPKPPRKPKPLKKKSESIEEPSNDNSGNQMDTSGIDLDTEE